MHNVGSRIKSNTCFLFLPCLTVCIYTDNIIKSLIEFWIIQKDIKRDTSSNVLNEIRKNPPAEVAGQNFGLNPEDWEVTLVAIQYELQEEGGKASVSGSFSGFGAYTSDLPF